MLFSQASQSHHAVSLASVSEAEMMMMIGQDHCGTLDVYCSTKHEDWFCVPHCMTLDVFKLLRSIVNSIWKQVHLTINRYNSALKLHWFFTFR